MPGTAWLLVAPYRRPDATAAGLRLQLFRLPDARVVAEAELAADDDANALYALDRDGVHAMAAGRGREVLVVTDRAVGPPRRRRAPRDGDF